MRKFGEFGAPAEGIGPTSEEVDSFFPPFPFFTCFFKQIIHRLTEEITKHFLSQWYSLIISSYHNFEAEHLPVGDTTLAGGRCVYQRSYGWFPMNSPS